MTLREMFPEWWCKVTFSVQENCSGDYDWLDFSIFEFIFTVVIVLVIKWIIYCFFFIVGLIIPDKTLEKEIEDIKKININLNYCYLLIARTSILNDPYENIKQTLFAEFEKIK